jgi:ribosome biogenesis GTPase YqeH
MNEMKTIRRCPGCGVILQTIDEKLPGYVPNKHVDRHEVVLCQRCFKLQHYGEDIAPKESFLFDDFYQILIKAKKDQASIIWVLDILNFETTLSMELLNAVKGLKVYFIATKRDLLPKTIQNKKLETYIQQFLESMHMPFEKIIIASSKTNQAMDDIKTMIAEDNQGKDLYVIGATSSGKSSLINTYLKHFSNQTKKLITTSPFPGTTLRVIEIPLNDQQTIYDTPGYVANHSMLAKVEKEVIKTMMPKVEIKPMSFRLGAKDALAIGGLVRLDVLSGKKEFVYTFFANPITYQKMQVLKADESFFKMIEKKQLKPISKSYSKMADFTTIEFTLPTKGRIDLAISGYGWLNFLAQGQTIRLLLPKGVLAKLLPSKVQA